MKRVVLMLLLAVSGCSQQVAMPPDEQSIVTYLESFSSSYSDTENGLQQDRIADAQSRFLRAHVLKTHVRHWTGTIEKIDSVLDIVLVRIRVGDHIIVEDQVDPKSPLVATLASINIGDAVEFSGSITSEGSITDAGRTTDPELYIDLSGIAKRGSAESL